MRRHTFLLIKHGEHFDYMIEESYRSSVYHGQMETEIYLATFCFSIACVYHVISSFKKSLKQFSYTFQVFERPRYVYVGVIKFLFPICKKNKGKWPIFVLSKMILEISKKRTNHEQHDIKKGS